MEEAAPAQKDEAVVAELKLLKGLVEHQQHQLVEMKAQAATSSITQTLQWGISNSARFNFTYWIGCNNQALESAGLVEGILGAFMQGMGQSLPAGAKLEQGWGTATPEQETAFRDKLGEQIHSLTGSKPRMVPSKQAEGRFAIYRV